MDDRRAFVERQLARLVTPQTAKTENAAQPTRAAFFDGEMVHIEGAPYPISRTLAMQMGCDLERLPHGYDAGDDDARSD